MKIGYVMQLGEEVRYPPYNGPANHIRQVIMELKRHAHEVCLLIRLEGKILKSDNMVDFSPVTVRLMDQGPLRWFEKLVRRIQYELKLPFLGLFDSIRFALACRSVFAGYDLLYERFSWMGYGGAIASRWLKIPLVVEYNGNPLDDLERKHIAPAGFQLKIAKRLMAQVFRQASHVIASGEGWRGSCMEKWSVPTWKVTTVENGTDLLHLLKREQLRSFQEKTSDSITRLVFLGGFDPWHGTQILIAAFARAVNQGSDLQLTMIGSGVGLEDAKKQASDLGVDDRIEFTGRLSTDEYTPYLANSDIGVSPYCGWVEFSGLKLFDYKAAGLACLASGKDGQPTTLQHGKTGWIVPPCDEDALFEAIVYLSSHKDFVHQMGQAGRVEAEKLHSWDHTIERLEEIFIGVLR